MKTLVFMTIMFLSLGAAYTAVTIALRERLPDILQVMIGAVAGATTVLVITAIVDFVQTH